ncbi:MAG: hypothetical protein IPM74_19470 [Crocinitomicaceae bacterium]|nr:hypothetical protein [Crocinitomicaceae bacterium]
MIFIFFGTEINLILTVMKNSLNELEKSIPFFMLTIVASHPVVYSGDHEMRICQAYDDYLNFDTKKLEKDFEIESRDGVYKLSLRHWTENPHFAIAYFDTIENCLLRTAFTYEGFTNSLKLWNNMDWH